MGICRIKTRDDSPLSEVHADIDGCECSFFDVCLSGLNYIIITVPVTNSGRSRTVRTSPVVSSVTDGNSTIVTTENSVYSFS